MRSPMVMCYGAGVDSTAILVEFVRRDIRPDLILFADTGSEKPATYAYLDVMDAFLARHGFPQVTRVRRSDEVNQRVPDQSIEDEMVRLGTLPSLAFGRHTCSHKWKVVPQEKFLARWALAQIAWAKGVPVTRVIGFDCSKQDSKRVSRTMAYDSDKYRSWFPLQDWGWDRDRCEQEIAREGLEVPVKSACYFCPASKPWELRALAKDSPELLKKALEIEDAVQEGGSSKHTLKADSSVAGLWRKQTWRSFVEAEGLLEIGPVEEWDFPTMTGKDVAEMDEATFQRFLIARQAWLKRRKAA